MFALNKKYLFITLGVLLVEVLIACLVHDNFVRPYVGDVLVVILIYSFVKTFTPLPVLRTCIMVLLLSFSIEFLQYLNVLKILGWQQVKILQVVLGTAFEWLDLLAYVVGGFIVLLAERLAGEEFRSKP